MKPKQLTVVVAIILILAFAVAFYSFMKTGSIITEAKAIALVKMNFPEYQDYPSDELPPRLIISEKVDDGWYLAFVQEGSGRLIISARCFLVKNDESVIGNGWYEPDLGDDVVGDFSPRTCRVSDASITPSVRCELETCHGLNLVCGSNPPQVCTEMYEIGDKCHQYAQCEVREGECTFVDNLKFSQCKQCVESCVAEFKNDPAGLFDCESNCEEFFTPESWANHTLRRFMHQSLSTVGRYTSFR